MWQCGFRRAPAARSFGSGLLLAAGGILALASTPFAWAQDYPTQPVRVVVPFAPGAGNDLLGRLVASELTARLGQNVYVENKPGAGSQIGVDLVAKAKPDGYTLLWTASDGITVLPAIKANVPYRVPEDFVFIAAITQQPYAVAISPKLPIKSIAELLAYGKTNSTWLRYASSGVGSGPHMTAALIGKTGGIEMVHVPYGGLAPALQAVLAGTVDLAVVTPPFLKPYTDSGTLNAIATTGRERIPLFPDTPTLEQAGLPITSIIIYGILAPPGTPEPIQARLRKEVSEMMRDPKFTNRLSTLGYQPGFVDAAAYKDFVVKDLEQWRAVAKAANIAITD